MSLDKLRGQIDQIDAQIIALINSRYKLVKEVGKWKEGNSSNFFVPEREKQLLERLHKLNTGLLPEKALLAIYREIFSGARFLERDLQIGFLGPDNTFSHQAAKEKFGECLSYVASKSIEGVFEAVVSQDVDYGVVPVENSIEGAVNSTLDLLIKYNCLICAEINTHPQQCLMSKGKMDKVTSIHSHPHALGQCRSWLYRHYPTIKLVETSSTAKAAQKASKDERIASISSVLSASQHNLVIHYKGIEDNKNNTTRFLVLSNQKTKPSGIDKTSLVFKMTDRVGALKSCLECFSDLGINLTMIESRPYPEEPNQHYFFIDCIGHQEDSVIREVLSKLQKITSFLKVLGSFPQA